jgi:beta-1,4-mannosyl-glycoprotein beta-1,4-N-acetylglucosaminyltransferase
MTVYDCCMFFNENDLYEIRLNQHWNFVDKFIVVEAGETHTGRKKPLYFDHARFAKYASKLEYRNFDNFADAMASNPELVMEPAQIAGHNLEDWGRDHFQYNYILKVLNEINAQDTDIVFLSCCDEMIREEAFKTAVDTLKTSPIEYPIFMFHLDLYAYKFNLFYQKWNDHVSANLTEFINFKRYLPAYMRDRYVCDYKISNGGWHFTFLDQSDDGKAVLEKQRSWAHSRDVVHDQKMKFDISTGEEALERFFKDYKVQIVPITYESHPKYIVDNLETMQDFIYKGTL